MKAIVVIGIGGALGSIARYLLSVTAMQFAGGPHFPLGTFIVNVLGCLIAGVLAGLVAKAHTFDELTRLFLFTGMLGGFTTFSAFGLDTIDLLRRGEVVIASSYVLLSVFAGLAAVWVGLTLGSR